jgi:magnesium-transporting ATPase (P-type)
MVFLEIVHIGNCRSETVSTFRLSPLKSPMLLFGSIIALAVHLAAAYIPILNEVLDVTPIDYARLTEIFALSLSILFVGEIHKIIWKIRQKRI